MNNFQGTLFVAYGCAIILCINPNALWYKKEMAASWNINKCGNWKLNDM